MKTVLFLALFVVCGGSLAQGQRPPPPTSDAEAVGALMFFVYAAETVEERCASALPLMRLRKVMADWRSRNAVLIAGVEARAGSLDWRNASFAPVPWSRRKEDDRQFARVQVEGMLLNDLKLTCEQTVVRFQAGDFDLSGFPEHLKLLKVGGK